ncbi:hypothetical protein MED92_16760 [Oceanospirillum sp. MED92]|uniref:Uncharacterized protein n=1 Tax=Neptuniibacter caesariensis TaxID=207954 RepID=A0A7U8C579_NEPCE|nr:hypothetical protein MED92_16760 [Oceanospirillum sp. MED92] [Neptuniibacter caesariensis]
MSLNVDEKGVSDFHLIEDADVVELMFEVHLSCLRVGGMSLFLFIKEDACSSYQGFYE